MLRFDRTRTVSNWVLKVGYSVHGYVQRYLD
jgi:hypothetical protein